MQQLAEEYQVALADMASLRAGDWAGSHGDILATGIAGSDTAVPSFVPICQLEVVARLCKDALNPALLVCCGYLRGAKNPGGLRVPSEDML